jgi:hypothetical protein
MLNEFAEGSCSMPFGDGAFAPNDNSDTTVTR